MLFRSKELGFVEKAVRHRHKELDNTMSCIRMQKSLIDTELRTGSYYGDETDTARAKTSFSSPDITEEDLSQLMAGIMATDTEVAPAAHLSLTDTDLDTAQPVVVSESKTPNPELDSIEKFLEGDDYADIFDDLK